MNHIEWNYCFKFCNSDTIDGLPLWASRILAFQLQPNLVIRQLYHCYNWSCATSLMDEFIAAKHPVPDSHTERWSTYT